MTAYVVFVDEAHFIHPEAIKAGPKAMVLGGACVIMASTPANGVSGIQDILDGTLEGTGETICDCVDYDFTCPICKEIFLVDETWMCPHRIFWRPPIQSFESVLISRAMYGRSIDAFNKEIMGTASMISDSFIPSDCIDSFRKLPPFIPQTTIRQVWCSADPSGQTVNYVDGHTSDYAIVTAYYQDHMYVVRICFILLFLFCFYNIFFYTHILFVLQQLLSLVMFDVLYFSSFVISFCGFEQSLDPDRRVCRIQSAIRIHVLPRA